MSAEYAERSWTTRQEQKAEWGPGPWNDEPDKIQWVDEATGLDCLVVRGPRGALCGYVGLPPGHPLHGVDDWKADHFDVHGGLTFADRCMEDMPEGEGVCHVPYPGRPADVWWLGFDCGHFMDLVPGLTHRLEQLEETPLGFKSHPAIERAAWEFQDSYKTVDYVKSEVTSLASQIKRSA